MLDVKLLGLGFIRGDLKGGTGLSCLWAHGLGCSGRVWEHVGQHAASSLSSLTTGRGAGPAARLT